MIQPPQMIPRTDLPTYPVHLQLLRVTGAFITVPPDGAILYACYTEQLRTDNLYPRDREPCWGLDVNQKGLPTQYCFGRLAGSYLSLPIYEVICGGDTVTIGIPPVPCAIQGKMYFDTVASKLYICDGGKWDVFCPCEELEPSSGSGGNTITIPCCPGILLPATLNVTFSDAGSCAALGGLSIPITYDSMTGSWIGSVTPACSALPCTVEFSCQDNGDLGYQWRLTTSNACAFNDIAPVTGTCSPLSVTFNFTVATASNCCFPGGMITAVVTK